MSLIIPPRYYLVTIYDSANITDKAENIHTILTSTDHIMPRERVEVKEYDDEDRCDFDYDTCHDEE